MSTRSESEGRVTPLASDDEPGEGGSPAARQTRWPLGRVLGEVSVLAPAVAAALVALALIPGTPAVVPLGVGALGLSVIGGALGLAAVVCGRRAGTGAGTVSGVIGLTLSAIMASVIVALMSIVTALGWLLSGVSRC